MSRIGRSFPAIPYYQRKKIFVISLEGEATASTVFTGDLVRIAELTGHSTFSSEFTGELTRLVSLVGHMVADAVLVGDLSIIELNLRLDWENTGLTLRNELSDAHSKFSLKGLSLLNNTLGYFLTGNGNLSARFAKLNSYDTLQIGNELFNTIADGDTLDVAGESNFIMLVADITDGEAAMFKCMGGTVTKWFGDTNIVAGSPSSGEIGLEFSSSIYRINNNKGSGKDVARLQILL